MKFGRSLRYFFTASFRLMERNSSNSTWKVAQIAGDFWSVKKLFRVVSMKWSPIYRQDCSGPAAETFGPALRVQAGTLGIGRGGARRLQFDGFPCLPLRSPLARSRWFCLAFSPRASILVPSLPDQATPSMLP